MKKLLCLLLSVMLLVAFFTGCKRSDDNNVSSVSQSVQEVESEYISSNESTQSSDNFSSSEPTQSVESAQTSQPIVSTPKEEITKPQDATNSVNSEPTSSIAENQASQSTPCSHINTTVKDQTSATCTQAGYSGDTICVDCGEVLSIGSQIAAIGHNSEIRGKQDATTTADGYTGDTYCKTCGIQIAVGEIIPKIKTDNDDKVTYTTNNGYTYVVDEGTNIMEYSMQQQTKSVNSKYREFEMEILRLCNEERAKVGLAPLEWYDDAYYFTHIRAEESSETFSHTRPNWSNWDTVYTDAGVILHGVWGENLFYAEGWPAYEIATKAVQEWMNSPGHKANILNPEYTRLTVAIYEKYIGEVYCLSVTQNFFD